MKTRTVLIKNGTIVTANEQYPGNVFIKGETIQAILNRGDEPEADLVVDAEGRFIIPGGVDEHTHMMDPGYTEREEFETGTAAAAYGGITTVIDHHRTVPAVYGIDELNQKIEYLRNKAVVDFALMGGISPDNIDALEAMWNRGITSFKTFTCNLHGVRAMFPGVLYDMFTEVKRFGGRVLIHCEDDNVCEMNKQRLLAEGRTDPACQIEWRSPLAEELAVDAVIAVTRETGARTTVAHVSQAKLLQKIHEAYESGVDIHAESCPHYFYLTDKDVVKLGPWGQFTPPPRSEENLEEMWRLFNLGYVDVIGSDHCPYPYEVKAVGEKNFWDAPNGIPGVETSMRIFLNAVNEGKTSLPKVVKVMCEMPARLNGLYPKKGALLVGSDADVVIIDMNHTETIRNENVVSKCKWSPYQGRSLKGAPETVFVRGNLVVDHYQVVAKPGNGKFTERM